MQKIGLFNKILGLYRNNLNPLDEASSYEPCICQYTCLDQVGRDFNAFEIFQHIILRIYPAVKRRILNYTKVFSSKFIKTNRRIHESTDMDKSRVMQKNLKCGDVVKILSYPEIEKTLNSKNKYKGLTFLAGMKPYCGEYAKVQREPLYVLDHGGRKIQQCKNIIICEKLYCDGSNIKCDRSCLYYWKKDWLKDTP